MKGDLSTLKKVCLYGSKVMAAGVAVITAVLAALLVLGIGSLFSGYLSSVLLNLLDKSAGTDSLILVSAYLEILIIMSLAWITVLTIYRVMTSIHSEHSPFNESNTNMVKGLSQVYLFASFALGILECTGGRGLASVAFMFFGCVLLSVVLYIFALIVRYGAVLQNESDHTL